MPKKKAQIDLTKLSKQEQVAYLIENTMPQERLEMAWQLSEKAFPLEAEFKSGSNRHIVRVIRLKDK